MPRRARIRDNDLNPSCSEQVLEQNEQSSQPESLEAGQLTNQQPNTLLSEPAINITSQADGNKTSKLTNQKEDLPAVELKKATFQLDKAVLIKLERFVLGLQLELGKENAPYKEVIVEEAIERLLTLNQSKLLKALARRQRRRKD